MGQVCPCLRAMHDPAELAPLADLTEGRTARARSSEKVVNNYQSIIDDTSRFVAATLLCSYRIPSYSLLFLLPHLRIQSTPSFTHHDYCAYRIFVRALFLSPPPPSPTIAIYSLISLFLFSSHSFSSHSFFSHSFSSHSLSPHSFSSHSFSSHSFSSLLFALSSPQPPPPLHQ
jgi:hypothetical protein